MNEVFGFIQRNDFYILVEYSELLAKERKDLYWEFIEVWLREEGNDADASTAKACLKKILKHGRFLLNEPLASLFEFSLVLRSASPRLVLYQQLADESLSSFPLPEENNSNIVGEGNESFERKISDTSVVGLKPKTPGGKCCWVDTGGSLFFDVPELLMWLQNPAERLVILTNPTLGGEVVVDISQELLSYNEPSIKIQLGQTISRTY